MRTLLVASAVAMAVAVASPLAACGQSESKADPAPKRNAAAASVRDSRIKTAATAGRDRRERTLDNMINRAVARFDRVDADGDGRVTRAELAAARPERAPESDAVGDDERPGRQNGQARRRGAGGAGLARADRDRDGIVTRAEVEDQARIRFKRRDANGDGVLTRDEMGGAGRRRGGRGDGDNSLE